MNKPSGTKGRKSVSGSSGRSEVNPRTGIKEMVREDTNQSFGNEQSQVGRPAPVWEYMKAAFMIHFQLQVNNDQ